LRSAYFSPDGQTVVTASKDRTAQVWSLAESIYSQLCNLDANIYHLTAADMEEYGIDVPLPYL